MKSIAVLGAAVLILVVRNAEAFFAPTGNLVGGASPASPALAAHSVSSIVARAANVRQIMPLPVLLFGTLGAIPRSGLPLRRVLGAHAGSPGGLRLWRVLPGAGRIQQRLLQLPQLLFPVQGGALYVQCVHKPPRHARSCVGHGDEDGSGTGVRRWRAFEGEACGGAGIGHV